MSIPQLFAAATSGGRQHGQVGPDALSDDLLLHIFSLVPGQDVETSQGVQITTRGGLERVCQRWRRLALSLPCRRIQLMLYKQRRKSFIGQELNILDTLCRLKLLAGRKSLELELCGLVEEIAGWELLASALLPSVHRQLPQLTHVRLKLRELATQLAAALAGMQQLQSLRLSVCGLMAALTATPPFQPQVGGQVPPQQVIVGNLPDAECWACLRQLGSKLQLLRLDVDVCSVPSSQRCFFQDHLLPPPPPQPTPQVLWELMSLLDVGRVELVLRGDTYAPEAELPPLPLVPNLQQLTLIGMDVEWHACSQLTSLDLKFCHLYFPDVGFAYQLGSMQRLVLNHCTIDSSCRFWDGLRAMHQLTSLVVVGEWDCHDFGLPYLPSLRHLQQVALMGVKLDQRTLDNVLSVTSLTELHIADCTAKTGKPLRFPVEDLPFIPSLRALNIAGTYFQQSFGQMLFAISGVPQLQTLRLSLNADQAELMEQWQELQGHPQLLSQLQVLSADLRTPNLMKRRFPLDDEFDVDDDESWDYNYDAIQTYQEEAAALLQEQLDGAGYGSCKVHLRGSMGDDCSEEPYPFQLDSEYCSAVEDERGGPYYSYSF